MTTLTVDVSRTIGTLKQLHGLNNGPVGYGSLVDVSHHYADLGVPCVRLHDTNWPHPREVDIPQVFPDFWADADDPRSYDFTRTDTYIRKILDTGATIIYRLGVSIEHTKTKYYTQPPPDYEQWARICLGIARHYNYGWANGYRDWVSYWEIWNEADIGERMWTGSVEEYFELYALTSKLLKSQLPTLRVGGPATAKHEPPQPASRFLDDFLGFCKSRGCPLDFISWHKYTTQPHTVVKHARDVRDLAERHGYAKVESHLNEWNYTPFEGAIWGKGNELARRRAFERQKGEEGAAFIGATLALLQDEPVDVACYYDGQPSALYCGVFDYYGVPQKAFYAFKAFRVLFDHADRLLVTATPVATELHCVAAGNPSTGEGAILLSRFGGEPSHVSIALSGLPDNARRGYAVTLIDSRHTYEIVESGRFNAGETALRIPMEAYAVALITLS